MPDTEAGNMEAGDTATPAEEKCGRLTAGGEKEYPPDIGCLIDESALRAMSLDQRQTLAALLVRIDGPGPIRVSRWRYRIGLAFYTAASLFMITWIVDLALTLPDRYVAGQWRTAWVGYDVAMLVMLAGMAWAVWRRRHIALPIMIMTATLLLCDAWFDVTLSWGGREAWDSILTALGCEIPLGVLLLTRARAAITRMAGIAVVLTGTGSPPSALHRIPLLVGIDNSTPH
jgi:hypothetical protein